jgi:preprotein translocase subunit SecA
MIGILKKVFGTKQDKDVKLLQPLVDRINEEYEKLHSLSDDEIRAKTDEFRQIIKENTAELEQEKAELENKLANEAMTADEIADTHENIKRIDEEIFETINDTLDELLPEAYAVVKQVCKRLTEQKYRYEYSGNTGVWEMIPYDVQLMGAIVLHQGKIAEMATGEGKTLVATLPMYLNALSGKGVHLVTVNDYLAKRDAEWMMPVYDFLGLSIGIIQSNMDNDQRKKMYNCDITYGTNNEFGFDYLRDNMVSEIEQMVQRPHWYAIVDEVDSVLIDEARTPLIISGPVGQASDQKFDELNPRVQKLVDAQIKLINRILKENEENIKSKDKEKRDKGGIALLKAHRALPKHKKLIKLLQEPENMTLLKETELFFMREQGRRMHEIDDDLYYSIDEKNHQIDISDKGRELLAGGQEDSEMFVIPDMGTELHAIEKDESLSEKEKQQKIDELNLLFAERSDRIHTISQLLRAYSLYEKDVDYVIQDNKVMIVDEFTGRILDGRRYSEGLHQAIEAKEHVKVERDTQTLATITLQNYFRLYKKLAGMTGTAETEAGEFDKIYSLEVVVIPTNRKIVRDDRDDLIYKTKREKYNAIVDLIEEELAKGRALLVGTTTVEVSELLSKMLKRRKIHHNVLNAKHHAREAEIVAGAGKKGAVTIATNMAGRGTDIKLDHDVKKNGGLAIIGSERHDARRIDRQLRGRAGRQGDPGSSQFFISLEDDLMRLFGGERIAGVMKTLKIPEGEPIQHSMITKNVERAQKKVEENNFGIRKRLLEYDDVMNQQREVIYTRRKNALRGDRLRGELFDYIEDMAFDWYDQFYPALDIDGLRNACRATLLSDIKVEKEEFEKMKDEDVVKKIVDAANEFYSRKEDSLGTEFMAYLERVAVLQTIDEKWRDHLREMDDLKEGIHLRSYGQKDPLLEYKQEAFKMFVDLIKEINKESVEFAFKYFPKIVEKHKTKSQAPRRAIPKVRTTVMDTSSLSFSHSEQVPDYLRGGGGGGGEQQDGGGEPVKVQTYRKTEKKVGRNDPCPCGSGKKYKHCCGRTNVN